MSCMIFRYTMTKFPQRMQLRSHKQYRMARNFRGTKFSTGKHFVKKFEVKLQLKLMCTINY